MCIYAREWMKKRPSIVNQSVQERERKAENGGGIATLRHSLLMMLVLTTLAQRKQSFDKSVKPPVRATSLRFKAPPASTCRQFRDMLVRLGTSRQRSKRDRDWLAKKVGSPASLHRAWATLDEVPSGLCWRSASAKDTSADEVSPAFVVSPAQSTSVCAQPQA